MLHTARASCAAAWSRAPWFRGKRPISWQATETAILSKPIGRPAPGGVGRLMCIVLDDPMQLIATGLCINTESARILDWAAPLLDDGYLSRLPWPVKPSPHLATYPNHPTPKE